MKKMAKKRYRKKTAARRQKSGKKEILKSPVLKSSFESKKKRTPAPKKKKERKSLGESFRLHKSLFVLGITLGIVVLVLLGGLIYVKSNYTVTNVYVEGNTYYTDKEIVDMVMKGRFSHNSIYLAVKYRNKSIENIPFIEKMDVNILSPDTIRINVYEKALAGYVEYLGRYMYFDREGTVVESSKEKANDIPQVMGLDFNYVVMYKKLPVKNQKIFAEILDITQLLGKYNLKADRIFFDSDYNVYLYFNKIEVDIGTEDNIDEKIIQLQYILPNLKEKSGVLEMREYDEDTQNVTFKENG
ncbi:MAG: FtsQ-type POTRA domain-containing protein [Butyrivibrio sp.]|nr:FtsQ-type POTRA domain-containing protein [Butyrivibrio sp.]